MYFWTKHSKFFKAKISLYLDIVNITIANNNAIMIVSEIF